MLKTLAELLSGPYTASLKIIDHYPYGDEEFAVEGLSVLEEPDLLEIATKNGWTTALKVHSIGLNENQIRLFSENGFKILTVNLMQGHPLREQLAEFLKLNLELIYPN